MSDLKGLKNYDKRVQKNRERLVGSMSGFSRTFEDLKQFGDFIVTETGGIHVMRCSQEDVKSCVKHLKRLLDEYQNTAQAMLDEYEEY